MREGFFTGLIDRTDRNLLMEPFDDEEAIEEDDEDSIEQIGEEIDEQIEIFDQGEAERFNDGSEYGSEEDGETD